MEHVGKVGTRKAARFMIWRRAGQRETPGRNILIPTSYARRIRLS